MPEPETFYRRGWPSWGGAPPLDSVLAVVAALGTAAYLIAALSPAAGSPATAMLGDVVAAGNSLLGIAFAFRAAGARRLARGIRRAWACLAWGFVCALLGELALLAAGGLTASAAPRALFVLCYLFAYPLFLLGCLLFPSELASGPGRHIFWLDAATVLLAAGIAIWYFTVYPAVARAGLTPELVMVVAFPALDLVLLFGVVRLALSRPAPAHRGPVALLILCFTLLIVPSLLFIAQQRHTIAATAPWDSALSTAGLFAAVMAAFWQRKGAGETGQAHVPGGRPRPLTPMLPYTAIVAGYALLVFSLAERLSTAAGHVLIGALLLTALVVLRQLLAIRATERARGEAERANAALSEAKATLERQAVALQRQMAELEELRDRLREQSLRDELTGLYNRRHLTEVLPQLFSQAARYGRPLAVLLFDIDDFKGVNDRFGHGVGDLVLQTVARLLRERTRSSDVLARFGGEEFIIIFPETDLAGAATYAEHVRAAVEDYDWRSLRPGLQVTLSGGVAACDGRPGPEALLHTADELLYRAKGGGKNRIAGGPPEREAVAPSSETQSG